MTGIKLKYIAIYDESGRPVFLSPEEVARRNASGIPHHIERFLNPNAIDVPRNAQAVLPPKTSTSQAVEKLKPANESKNETTDLIARINTLIDAHHHSVIEDFDALFPKDMNTLVFNIGAPTSQSDHSQQTNHSSVEPNQKSSHYRVSK